MKKYDVTIAFPVYNAAKYLRDTMLSALAQDYPSIEFLVLDDCGTDGSMEIVRQLQREHPRGEDIRIVSQEHNMGVGAARNRILKEARGQYLYFLDADDLIIPSTISLLMETARKYQAEVVMASYERIKLYHDEPQKTLFQFQPMVFTERHALATYAFSHYGALQANVWNVLMDLRLIRECHMQFVNTNFWEDMAFKYDLVTHVTRAVLLPDVTYSYMCRENSLSNFLTRKEISKDEVFRNVATIDTLKHHYERILGRPYFAKWLQFVLDTDYFIICDVLQKRELIHPRVSDVELRNMLYSPLNIMQTLRHGNPRCWFYKLLTLLPASWAVGIVKLLVKVNKYT